MHLAVMHLSQKTPFCSKKSYLCHLSTEIYCHGSDKCYPRSRSALNATKEERT